MTVYTSETYDITGATFIDGVTNFTIEALFETMALVVPDGELANAFDCIEMHPDVVTRFLAACFNRELEDRVRREGLTEGNSPLSVLGLPVVINRRDCKDEQPGVYKTRVWTKPPYRLAQLGKKFTDTEQKIGILRTRER